MHKYLAGWMAALVALAWPAVLAAEPLLVYEGGGLVIRVLSMSDDETSMSGELVRDGATYPFTGKSVTAGEVETVTGTFRAGNGSYAFTATVGEDAKTLTFVTGGATYKLREVDPNAAAAAPKVPPPSQPAAPAAPAAPMAPAAPTAPAVQPAAPAAVTTRDPKGAAAAAGAALPETLTMRPAEFRDADMADIVAYTLLIPEGWQATGQVRWSQGRTPYPQKQFDVNGPDGSRIAFRPAMTFTYSEATEVTLRESAAMGMESPIPRQAGDPPPKDVGAWLASAVARNQGYANVKLLGDRRDEAAEAAARGQMTSPGTWQVHVVTLGYEFNGQPLVEEVHLSYAQLPPMLTRNVNVWNWMLFIDWSVRAPPAKFEGMKPLLAASARSLQTSPRWFALSQQVIRETQMENHRVTMDEIRRRGEQNTKLSDEMMAAWRKQQIPDDKKQEQRINQIYEVSDFAGPDGTTRKLPNGFQHYYSDGQGGFRMSNSAEPPGAGWTPVEPTK